MCFWHFQVHFLKSGFVYINQQLYITTKLQMVTSQNTLINERQENKDSAKIKPLGMLKEGEQLSNGRFLSPVLFIRYKCIRS